MMSGSLDIIVVHGPPTGAAQGIQIAILTMLLGGLPAALLALVLARRSDASHQRWGGGWAQPFVAGFVFQLGSLFFAAVFLLILVLAFVGSSEPVTDLYSVLLTSGLLLNITCSVAALRAWQRLRASVSPDTLTLA